ncbi:MAG: hypothetical protein OXI87_17570, partial [Albidovulum sp.]|nr:hypothetical protein [Albidovulum sp.]
GDAALAAAAARSPLGTATAAVASPSTFSGLLMPLLRSSASQFHFHSSSESIGAPGVREIYAIGNCLGNASQVRKSCAIIARPMAAAGSRYRITALVPGWTAMFG